MKYFVTFILVLIFVIFLPTNNIIAQTTIPPTMIYVKGGSFKMGSNNGYPDERPVHNVNLSDFYISKYEITVAQYRAFCNATGHKMPIDPNKAWYEEHDNAVKWQWIDTYPIVYVTYYDAIAFCKWLSETTHETYTLPTEAQWEYAARGGNQSKNYKYSGSNNIDEVAWYDETTNEKGLRSVGKLKPNELGIYDMSGNAWEWCLDFYGTYPSSSQRNPQGPSKGDFRVIRGGSWYYSEDMTKVTSRDGPKPTFTNYNYGFRVVKKK
ncbi:MAG: formylglycine-generating enzyme family protein [Bacteroidales bacterium]|nr:formylglycine-generating enzyme family protein [Bacteroidales bacterium]